MSHIHIPDGVLPFSWWFTGLLAAGVLIFLSLYVYSDRNRKSLSLVGIMSALSLIVMSIPLGFLPFHINLMVMTGIILGPWSGITVAFIVNLFLALIGHGGITVIGLNTIILGAEAFTGGFLYRKLNRRMGAIRAVAVATVAALLFSYLLMASIVIGSGITSIYLQEKFPGDTAAREEIHNPPDAHRPIDRLPWQRFILLTLPLQLIGIILETTVNMAVVRFLMESRPDLVSG